MLPGSLLRYHEKFKVSTLLSLSVAAVAAPFCTVGQKLQAQGLLIQDVDSNIHHLLNCTRMVCWTMLLFNTAPQFVGASNTLHKTNIVETQSYYVDTMGLGVDLCTGLMAFGFASVAQPQMLIEHSSNFVHPVSHMLNLLLHKALLIWCFCTGMLSELHPCVG